MVHVPCGEKLELKRGPWTPEEDHKLLTYIQSHGHSSWRALPKQAGLSRCGKSCRLRWTNYLRPGIKRGNFSSQEENTIIQLHAALGNRWSTISTRLPGRTDNEIKNHWNTRLRKRLLKMGIDPTTHRPLVQQQQHHPPLPSSISTLLLSLLHGAPSAADAPNSSLLHALLFGPNSFANNNASFPAAPGHVLQSAPPCAAHAPPSSSVLPPPVALDPALLAAAETRLLLDCLKFNNSHNHVSTSDHPLNQTLTRLLLLRLLQGATNRAPAPSNSAAACYSNKVSIAQHADQRSGPLSANHVLQNQGLHPVASNRETAAAPAAYVNYAFNDSNSSTTMLLNMFSSSYQQRLLQTLPFLAESVIEPCTSAADADHLSSTSPSQLSQARFYNSPPELSTANGGLTSQQTPQWRQGQGRNEVVPNGGQGVTRSEVMASGAQLLGGGEGMNMQNSNGPGSLMTWEEHLMREQELNASSSTVSSSTLSSASHPNIQDYWSELLNLITSTT